MVCETQHIVIFSLSRVLVVTWLHIKEQWMQRQCPIFMSSQLAKSSWSLLNKMNPRLNTQMCLRIGAVTSMHKKQMKVCRSTLSCISSITASMMFVYRWKSLMNYSSVVYFSCSCFEIFSQNYRISHSKICLGSRAYRWKSLGFD